MKDIVGNGGSDCTEVAGKREGNSWEWIKGSGNYKAAGTAIPVENQNMTVLSKQQRKTSDTSVCLTTYI